MFSTRDGEKEGQEATSRCAASYDLRQCSGFSKQYVQQPRSDLTGGWLRLIS